MLEKHSAVNENVRFMGTDAKPSELPQNASRKKKPAESNSRTHQEVERCFVHIDYQPGSKYAGFGQEFGNYRFQLLFFDVGS